MSERAVDAGTGIFRVLVVCHANLCRSPMMEFLLREPVNRLGLPWQIDSAGIRADDGQPMHKLAERALRNSGIDTSEFSSRRLRVAQVAGADLVLTAAEAQRDAVVQLHPRALTRTFTLRQFAHLVTGARLPSPAAATFGSEVVALARASRSRVQPLSNRDRDLADPLGHSFGRFSRTAHLIRQCLGAVVGVLESGPAERGATPSGSVHSLERRSEP